MRSLARRFCRTAQTAEDVTQATMATAIEQPPKSILQLRGCLATVTRNLASKHYRKDRQSKRARVRPPRSRHSREHGENPPGWALVKQSAARTTRPAHRMATPWHAARARSSPDPESPPAADAFHRSFGHVKSLGAERTNETQMHGKHRQQYPHGKTLPSAIPSWRPLRARTPRSASNRGLIGCR